MKKYNEILEEIDFVMEQTCIEKIPLLLRCIQNLDVVDEEFYHDFFFYQKIIDDCLSETSFKLGKLISELKAQKNQGENYE